MNSSGWDIPSTKWKASLCHRRHTRHHRWHSNIGARFCPTYIQTLSVLRRSVWLRSYWKISYRAFRNSYWMAVEKHGQYFSRGWQSIKVFLIPRIPQDLVLPPFSRIGPLTLCFTERADKLVQQGVSLHWGRPKYYKDFREDRTKAW